MNCFLHEVDCGDIIHSLATVQAAGGGRYWLKPTKPQLQGLLDSLLNAQDYIESFAIWNRTPITHDFSTFRKGGIPWGVPLGKLHADWVKVKVDFSKPWLQANPSKRSLGKIVVNRTARYQNHYFPWKPIVSELGRKILFIGLENEWKSLCNLTGKCIEYVRTKDMLDVAELIAGSELFIGNQSSPNAIAEGLKHPLIQETCLRVPDCIYPRKNAVHCADGNVYFEFIGKQYSYESIKPAIRLPKVETPPGGWKVFIKGKEMSHYCLNGLIANIRQIMRSDMPDNIENMIHEYTVSGLKLDTLPAGTLRQISDIQKLSQAKMV